MALNRNQLNKISAYVKSASAKTKELHSYLRSNRAKMSRAQLDKIRKSVSKEYKNISQVYNSIKKNIAFGDIRRIASDAELDEMMDTLAVTGTSLDLINTVLNENDDVSVSQIAEEDEDVTVDEVLDSLGEGGELDEDVEDVDDVPGSKSSASRRAVARGSYSKSRAYDLAYGRGRGSRASMGRSSGGFIDFRKRSR